MPIYIRLKIQGGKLSNECFCFHLVEPSSGDTDTYYFCYARAFCTIYKILQENYCDIVKTFISTTVNLGLPKFGQNA